MSVSIFIVSFFDFSSRNLLLPTIRSILPVIDREFSAQFVSTLTIEQISAIRNSASPEVLTKPIYYAMVNLRPFDVPVASAVVFVGMIYLLLLTFFPFANSCRSDISLAFAARTVVLGDSSWDTGSRPFVDHLKYLKPRAACCVMIWTPRRSESPFLRSLRAELAGNGIKLLVKDAW